LSQFDPFKIPALSHYSVNTIKRHTYSDNANKMFTKCVFFSSHKYCRLLTSVVINKKENKVSRAFEIVWLVQRLTAGWAVQESKPGGGIIFRTHPDQPRYPPILLYYHHQVSFPSVKQPKHSSDHSSLLVLRLKKEENYTLLPPLCLHGVASNNCTLL
jgi:hypothetical protein